MLFSIAIALIGGTVWKRTIRVCAMFLCLFLDTGFMVTAHAQHSTVSIRDIEAAWKKRESLMRSVEYEWEETELVRANSRPQILTKDPKMIPEKDLQLSRKRSIEVSGKMSRHSHVGDFFRPKDGSSEKKNYVSVCDGLVAKNFHDSPGRTEFPKSGFIYKEVRNYDITVYPLLPVMMFARPLQKSLGGIDLEEFAISPKRGYCSGRECTLIESKIPSRENGKLVYWVDAGQNYIVRRFEEKFGSRDSVAWSQIDIEFDVHSDFGWIPTRWKQSSENGSNQFNMQVTKSKFNHEVEMDRFRFEFPQGTAVVDLRTNERFIASNDSEDRRIVTNAELRRGATYQELRTTASGEAKGRDAKSNNVWNLGVILLILIAISAVAIMSSRKNKK